jgi:hypothetical protein
MQLIDFSEWCCNKSSENEKRPYFGKQNKVKTRLFLQSQFMLIHGFVVINSIGVVM